MIFWFHRCLWQSRNSFLELDCGSSSVNTCFWTFKFEMGSKYVVFLYCAVLCKFCRCAKLFLIFCDFLEQIIVSKKMKVRFCTIVNAEHLVILFLGIFYHTTLNFFLLFFSATHNLFLLIDNLLTFDLFIFDLLHFDLFVIFDLLLLISHYLRI